VAWLNRFFGGRRTSDPKKGPESEQCLSAAGWQPGRICDTTAVEEALRQAGFRLHNVGRQFLREYLGLSVEVPIAGHDGITGFVHFAPDKVLRMLRPGDLPRLAALMPASACPVGTTSGHTVFVFMDDLGRSYLLDMEWSLFAALADTPAEMVLALCDGRNGRVDSQILDDQGRPTSEVIRAADERRHWQLERFPSLAPFLPPASLSPARRPPTWRAMVRATEQLLSQGGAPSGLLVTCGGFTVGPPGQHFFVAHCENCLYVRSRAGFRVSAPPPGVPPGFRVGEVIAFRPPAGW
jgi:SUKH-3 immunity protein